MGLDMGAFNRAWLILKNINYMENFCSKCKGTGKSGEFHPMYGNLNCQSCGGTGMLMPVNPMDRQYESELSPQINPTE